MEFDHEKNTTRFIYKFKNNQHFFFFLNNSNLEFNKIQTNIDILSILFNALYKGCKQVFFF